MLYLRDHPPPLVGGKLPLCFIDDEPPVRLVVSHQVVVPHGVEARAVAAQVGRSPGVGRMVPRPGRSC